MLFHNPAGILGCLFVAVGCFVAGFVPDVSGQTSTGTLTGIIEGQDRAVLPNVNVTVTDMNRNTVHVTRTNDVGHYAIPALSPGRYSIAAVLPGFKRIVQEGIVMQLNQSIRINLRMDVGSIEQSVVVTDSKPLLETETASRGSV